MYLKFSSVPGFDHAGLVDPGSSISFPSSQFPPNLWIISGSSLDTGQKPHVIIIPFDPVFSHLLLQWQVWCVYLHTFHCLFSDQICAKEAKAIPCLLCLMKPGQVMGWTQHLNALSDPTPPALPQDPPRTLGPLTMLFKLSQ